MDDIVDPINISRHQILDQLRASLSSSYENPNAIENAKYQLEHAIDLLEDKWDSFSVGIENALKQNAANLKRDVTD